MSVKAYRKRPLWTVLLALAFVFAPIGNLLVTLIAFRVPHWWSPQVWSQWISGVSPTLLALQVLIFVSGVALLFVRNWSWTIALFTLSVACLYNVFSFQSLLKMGPWAVGVMVLLTLVGIAVMLYSPFRRPYLNPRLRWWETSPRFRADIRVIIEGVPGEAILVDVSRTGALLEWREIENIPQLEGLKQMTLAQGPILSCIVIRRTPKGYGLNFHKLSPASKKYLKNWLAELAKDPTRFAR